MYSDPVMEGILEGETDFRGKSWFCVSSNQLNEIMIIDLFLVALLLLVFAFAY